MVLTAAKMRVFYKKPNQMGIPHATVIHLQEERIDSVSDLGDFDKDNFDHIAVNLRRPTGSIPDPNPTAAAGSTILMPPLVFGANSQKRLIVAANLI